MYQLLSCCLRCRVRAYVCTPKRITAACWCLCYCCCHCNDSCSLWCCAKRQQQQVQANSQHSVRQQNAPRRSGDDAMRCDAARRVTLGLSRFTSASAIRFILNFFADRLDAFSYLFFLFHMHIYKYTCVYMQTRLCHCIALCVYKCVRAPIAICVATCLYAFVFRSHWPWPWIKQICRCCCCCMGSYYSFSLWLRIFFVFVCISLWCFGFFALARTPLHRSTVPRRSAHDHLTRELLWKFCLHFSPVNILLSTLLLYARPHAAYCAKRCFFYFFNLFVVFVWRSCPAYERECAKT